MSKINLYRQGHKEIITFFCKPEILVLIATKERNYTDATITREFRLMIFFVNKRKEDIMLKSL